MRISDWSSDVCSSDLPFFLPSAEVPTGWALCNGQTVTRSDGSGNITTPDLRGRFLIGVSDTYALSSLGGEASASVSTSEDGAHSHAVTVDAGGAHAHTGTVQGTADRKSVV